MEDQRSNQHIKAYSETLWGTRLDSDDSQVLYLLYRNRYAHLDTRSNHAAIISNKDNTEYNHRHLTTYTQQMGISGSVNTLKSVAKKHMVRSVLHWYSEKLYLKVADGLAEERNPFEYNKGYYGDESQYVLNTIFRWQGVYDTQLSVLSNAIHEYATLDFHSIDYDLLNSWLQRQEYSKEFLENMPVLPDALLEQKVDYHIVPAIFVQSKWESGEDFYIMNDF